MLVLLLIFHILTLFQTILNLAKPMLILNQPFCTYLRHENYIFLKEC